jgi:uncharacterized protein (TIGR00661 family)
MKILYAIQGTGNGHISCAREVIPYFQNHGDVDILVSGTESEIDLPYKIKYKFKGLSFVFGKNGGIDYLDTYKKSKLNRLYKEIKSLPVNNYDLIISDFEPVSAWACYLKNKQCVGLSHQIAVINKNAPQCGGKDFIGKAILNYYAPSTLKFGFHFLPYDTHIFTPLIRKELRTLEVHNKGHYTVYLPAFSDKRIIRLLRCFPQTSWEVFSKNNKLAYRDQNINIFPIEHDRFLKSMAGAAGVLCASGFQTPSETLHLRKKLMVVPMKGQYEQQCNATALKLLGVPVLKNLDKKNIQKIQEWLDTDDLVLLSFVHDTEEVVETIMEVTAQTKELKKTKERIENTNHFRQTLWKKIFQTKSNSFESNRIWK